MRTGIYIHVPFCRQRCSYCDFYFVTSHRRVPEFLGALATEIRLRAQALGPPVAVDTLYFGGGTPSRLGADQLGGILGALASHFDTSSIKEMTIEVNPEDVSSDFLGQLRDIGFTRVSIGVQSLDEEYLRFMNRSHTMEQAVAAVEYALATGFNSVSIDLIFGIPGMSKDDWAESLSFAASSGVQHVSLYGLTVEPRTLLGKWVRTGRVEPATEALMEDQYRTAHEIMTSQGFDHYEISNYAKEGHRSFHNQTYWDHSPYLGFGPAAHSFWRNGNPTRWENARNLRRYLDDLASETLPVSDMEQLDGERLAREYVLLGLRTDRGIDLNRLRSDYERRLTRRGDQLVSDLQDTGKVRLADHRITLTLDGQLLADSITSAFLNADVLEAA